VADQGFDAVPGPQREHLRPYSVVNCAASPAFRASNVHTSEALEIISVYPSICHPDVVMKPTASVPTSNSAPNPLHEATPWT